MSKEASRVNMKVEHHDSKNMTFSTEQAAVSQELKSWFICIIPSVSHWSIAHTGWCQCFCSTNNGICELTFSLYTSSLVVGLCVLCSSGMSSVFLTGVYVSVDATLAFISHRYPVFLLFSHHFLLFVLSWSPSLLGKRIVGQLNQNEQPCQPTVGKHGGGSLTFSQSRLSVSPQWPAVQLYWCVLHPARLSLAACLTHYSQ